MKAPPSNDELLNPEDVRASFADAGLSIAEWARSHNFSAGLVYHVLAGRNRATRGQSHKIAVALRLKRGGHDGQLRLGKSTRQPSVSNC